jgi:hypothetical protein
MPKQPDEQRSDEDKAKNFLEAFNAEGALTQPGHVPDEPPSPAAEADAPPPG